MKVHLRGTRKHSKYQLHVSTWQTPNWFERWILWRKPQVVEYVGKGTKWFVMTIGKKTVLEFAPVNDAVLLEWLPTVQLGDEDLSKQNLKKV